jgi:HSP20 family molecular chaperone IbpA
MTRSFIVPSCFFEDEWVASAFAEMGEILSSVNIRFPLSNFLINKKTGDLLIEMALAGYSPEDITITTEDSRIVVEGKAQSHNEDYEYRQQDIKQSSFKQGFPVSTKFDLTKLEAEFKNGILKLILPVSEERKPKQVKIKL